MEYAALLLLIEVVAAWCWYHYWPTDRTRDARDLARRKMKHTKR